MAPKRYFDAKTDRILLTCVIPPWMARIGDIADIFGDTLVRLVFLWRVSPNVTSHNIGWFEDKDLFSKGDKMIVVYQDKKDYASPPALPAGDEVTLEEEGNGDSSKEPPPPPQ